MSATETPHALDPTTTAGKLAQWAPIAAGPVLWTINELASYWIVTVSCAEGWRLGIAPVELPARVLVAGLAMLSLALLGWLLLPVWRRWNRKLDEQAPGQPYADRHEFMRLTALTTGALFAVGIVYNALTTVLLPTCTTTMR